MDALWHLDPRLYFLIRSHEGDFRCILLWHKGTKCFHRVSQAESCQAVTSQAVSLYVHIEDKPLNQMKLLMGRFGCFPEVERREKNAVLQFLPRMVLSW